MAPHRTRAHHHHGRQGQGSATLRRGRLITLAKKGTLHARGLALSRLGPDWDRARLDVNSQDLAEGTRAGDDRKIIKKLFDDIGPRFRDRAGGYTRIIKRHERRLGDAGRTAFLELLKEGEVKVRAKQPGARGAGAKW